MCIASTRGRIWSFQPNWRHRTSIEWLPSSPRKEPYWHITGYCKPRFETLAEENEIKLRICLLLGTVQLSPRPRKVYLTPASQWFGSDFSPSQTRHERLLVQQTSGSMQFVGQHGRKGWWPYGIEAVNKMESEIQLSQAWGLLEERELKRNGIRARMRSWVQVGPCRLDWTSEEEWEWGHIPNPVRK